MGADEQKQTDALDFATAQSTYKIITALVEQVDAASNLIAIMASALGEEATKKITETGAWANFLQGRRTLENLRPELEKFAATVNRLVNHRDTENTEK